MFDLTHPQQQNVYQSNNPVQTALLEEWSWLKYNFPWRFKQAMNSNPTSRKLHNITKVWSNPGILSQTTVLS